MTKVVTISNQKGGVGKTTTATILAHGLALKGKRTLILDLDPQGHCAILLGVEPGPGVYHFLVKDHALKEVTKAVRSNLWLIPGNKQTAFILDHWRVEASSQGHELTLDTLKHKIAPLLKIGLDYVIVDTNPTVGGLQDQALWASDAVLLPASTNYLGAVGLSEIQGTLRTMKSRGWKGGIIGVLPTFLDNSNDTQQLYKQYQNEYPDMLLQPIHRAAILGECASEGNTIWEMKLEEPSEKRAALEYGYLLTKVLESV